MFRVQLPVTCRTLLHHGLQQQPLFTLFFTRLLVVLLPVREPVKELVSACYKCFFLCLGSPEIRFYRDGVRTR